MELSEASQEVEENIQRLSVHQAETLSKQSQLRDNLHTATKKVLIYSI